MRYWAVAAATAVLAFSRAGSAAAQTPEAEALGAKVAQLLFDSIALDKAVVAQVQTSLGKNGVGIKSRPEWDRYFGEAMVEEIRHDLPQLERALGHALAQELTEAQLKSGVAIMSDPAVQQMMAAGAAKTRGPKASASPETEREVQTPDGKAFLAVPDKLDKLIDPLTDDFEVELMPGFFHRLADKMDAGEAAHRPIQGSVTK
jgi:hypothetical protein